MVELLDKHGSAPAGTSSLTPQAQCFVIMRHLLPIEKQKSLYAMLKEAVYPSWHDISKGNRQLGGSQTGL